MNKNSMRLIFITVLLYIQSIVAQNIEDMNRLPDSITDSDFDVDLKMNGVPVFDQGPYGTCVTFATTAALDAIKGSGDYISQQCLLELGNTYEAGVYAKEGFGFEDYQCNDSGWNGYDVECSLARIRENGVVAKTSCPNNYPSKENSSLVNEKLSIRDYRDLSQGQWSHDFVWRTLRNPNSTHEARYALDKGHRLIVSSLMNAQGVKERHLGYPVNGKKAALWALPRDVYNLEEFIYEVKSNLAVHSVIITGYSDKKRVFKVRNSWGASAGDNGDYYMSYDYYRMMNLQTVEIGEF